MSGMQYMSESSHTATPLKLDCMEASMAQHNALLLAQHGALLAQQNSLFMLQRKQMEHALRCHLLATIGAPPGLSLEPEQQWTLPLKTNAHTECWEQSTTCSSRQRSASPTSSHHSSSGEVHHRNAATSREEQTTTIIKNLVGHCTRDMLLEFLDESGFQGRYNLLYIPRCFASKRCFHYAFVNFVSDSDAIAFQARFNGCTDVAMFGDSTADVSFSECQGLAANIAKYRNSSVMHPSVPQECRPLLFQDGQVVAFPKPTKKIKEDRRTRKAAQESQAQEC